MTIQNDLTVTMYVAVGKFGDSFSHLSSFCQHIDDAASEAVDAMEKGYCEQAYVQVVQTGEDVTEAAKARVRQWCLDRNEDWPVWAEPQLVAAE